MLFWTLLIHYRLAIDIQSLKTEKSKLKTFNGPREPCTADMAKQKLDTWK